MTAPTVLKLKKSSVSKNFPSASDLEYGELALNYADGVIYYKNSSNAIKSFRDTTSNDSAVSIGDTLTLTSIDSGAAADPTLILYRNSGTPADYDDIGLVLFRGRNDNTQDVDYAKIYAEPYDVSDGNEGSRISLANMLYGTQTNVFMTGWGNIYMNHNISLNAGKNIRYEGATDNAHETTLTVTDPTQDNTVTFPDKTGTVAMTSDISGEAVVMAIALG